MKEKQTKLPGPDHPISIRRNRAHVVGSVAGRVVADTCNSLTLREAVLPAPTSRKITIISTMATCITGRCGTSRRRRKTIPSNFPASCRNTASNLFPRCGRSERLPASLTFYDDVLVSPYLDDDKVDIYIVSDKLQPFGGTIHTRLLDFSGKVLLDQTKDIQAPAQSSAIYLSFDKADLSAKGESS